MQALVQNGSGDKDLVNFSTEIVITICDARTEMDDCKKGTQLHNILH